jgi:hypothetical protein
MFDLVGTRQKVEEAQRGFLSKLISPNFGRKLGLNISCKLLSKRFMTNSEEAFFRHLFFHKTSQNSIFENVPTRKMFLIRCTVKKQTLKVIEKRYGKL